MQAESMQVNRWIILKKHICGFLAVWDVVQLPGTICSACVKDIF